MTSTNPASGVVDCNLDTIKQQITEIRLAFGTPSVSCGVLHHGRVVFRHGEGFADVEQKLKPDADTIYAIASCTKAFTSATCAVLVHEGKLSWTEPVSSYLPEFRTSHDETIGRKATLVDLCSHATGLAPVDHAVMGFHDEYYNKGTDQVKISAHLPVAYDFRSRWLYNNCMLGVVGEVISRVEQNSAGSVMKSKIFEPLGLTRTMTSAAEYPTDGNIAKGYSVLNDGSLLLLGDAKLEDGDIHGGAGFVRSTVNDMLRWAKAVMEAESRAPEFRTQISPNDDTPRLPGIDFTRCAHRPITFDNSTGENSYGLGWFRHTLPSQWLGSIGPNFALLSDPPVIGKESPPRLAIAHYGEFGGFLTAFYTFPDTCSAIVVMANSSPSRGDPTDLIAQALCQELFDMKPRVTIESYAHRAAKTARQVWPSLVEEWVTTRVQNTPMSPPSQYVGKFSNKGLMLEIDVFELPGSDTPSNHHVNGNPELLGFTINGLARQTARLRHYHYDVWTFLPDTRDDASRKGMELYMSLPLVLLAFVRDLAGNVNALEWDLQAGMCEGPAPGLETSVKPIRFEKLA